MSRRVITAEELLARPPFARPRPRKNGITPELRTAIVLRALAGENPECLGLEVGRSAATVLMWCSHWRTGQNAHLFVARAFGHETEVEIPEHVTDPAVAEAYANLARRRDKRPLLHMLDGGAA